MCVFLDIRFLKEYHQRQFIQIKSSKSDRDLSKIIQHAKEAWLEMGCLEKSGRFRSQNASTPCKNMHTVSLGRFSLLNAERSFHETICFGQKG